MGLLEGKVAIITGSTQGLGLGIARRFVREGARIALNGRSRDKGERVLAEVQQLGGEAIFVQADLGDPREARSLIESTVDRFGRLDILINNAQTVPRLAAVTDLTTDELFRVALDSGLLASLWTSQAALPHLIATGEGRIINFASINGAYGSRYGAAYNATKEAIRGLTRTLANEFGPHGVTVNVVLPAGLSPAYEAFYAGDPQRAAAVARLNPMRRHGLAEDDIGGAVLALASDAARYITGQSLYIDGGANLLGLPQLHELPASPR